MKALRIGIVIFWLIIAAYGAFDSKEIPREDNAAIAAKEEMEDTKGAATGYEDWVDREERIRFIKVCLAFQGTPYVYGGNTAAGMDCSGYVYRMYRTFDVTLPRSTKGQFKVGRFVEREELQEADLVFFNGSAKPLHVGIYLGDGKFIHAPSAGKKIRVDFLDTPYQFRHFIGGTRIRELKHGGRETR
jgi:hypothetical protein